MLARARGPFVNRRFRAERSSAFPTASDQTQEKTMTLSNKVALVTGANRGIGAAIVREMLKAGVAKIYATARDPETLPVFGDLRVVPLQLDVTSDASVNAAAAAAQDVD